tara:strand:- start:1594 stop:1905 length:312 start_codon:yes stop_codon:yes gene_type:complete
MFFVKVIKRDKNNKPTETEKLVGKPTIEEIKEFKPSYGFISDEYDFKTDKRKVMNDKIQIFANLINMKVKDDDGDLQRSNNDDAYYLTYKSKHLEDYLDVLES